MTNPTDPQVIRAGILEVLALIADPALQRQYQSNVPHVNVVPELFCMWADDLYHPDAPVLRGGFSPRELDVLARFAAVLDQVSDGLPEPPPQLPEFIASAAGQRLAAAARDTLDRLDKP